MTIIVAAVDHDGVIHAGSDTNALLGDDLWHGLSPDKMALLQTSPNDGSGDITGPELVLLGIAGRSSVMQAVHARRMTIGTPLALDIADLDRWAYGVAEHLTEMSLERELRDKGEQDVADFSGVLGFNGQLWMIAHYQCNRFTPDPLQPTTGNDLDEAYHPQTRPGWVAVGSGQSYAIGAMHSLYDHVDAEEAVDRALHAAGHNAWCAGPYKRLMLPPVRDGALV